MSNKSSQSTSRIASGNEGQDWMARAQARSANFVANIKSSPENIRRQTRIVKGWFRPNGWLVVSLILSLMLLGAVNQRKEVSSISPANVVKHRR